MSKISLAITLAAIAVATPSLAQERGARTASISYNDLNISSAAGRQQLDDRVSVAITRMCGTAMTFDLRAQADVRQCLRQARADYSAQRGAVLARAAPAAITVATR